MLFCHIFIFNFCAHQNPFFSSLCNEINPVAGTPWKKLRQPWIFGNKMLSLQFCYQGIPNPAISWSWPQNGLLSPRAGGGTSIYTDPDNVLHLQNVSDAGNNWSLQKNCTAKSSWLAQVVPDFGVMFLCSASNVAGKLMKEIDIRVVSAAPKIASSLQTTYTVVEGRSAVLDCQASAIPLARLVIWIKQWKLHCRQSWKIANNGNCENRRKLVWLSRHICSCYVTMFTSRSDQIFHRIVSWLCAMATQALGLLGLSSSLGLRLIL